MEDNKQASFSGWALMELMGHQKEIGYVTTEAFGQAVMFRVDTPGLEEREFTLTAPEYAETTPGTREWCSAGSKVKREAVPARSRLISPGALYAINPCTEEAARAEIERATNRPLILIEGKPTPRIAATVEYDDSDLCENCGHADDMCDCGA